MKNKVVVTREMFFDQVKSYITEPASLAMIEKAYEYAEDKHKDQKRKSGEPYFVHLMNVGDDLRVGTAAACRTADHYRRLAA